MFTIPETHRLKLQVLRPTLGLGIQESLGWGTLGLGVSESGVEPSRSLWVGHSAQGWALQEDSGLGTLKLGAQKDSEVGHSRSFWVGLQAIPDLPSTPGSLCGLETGAGHSRESGRVGHSREILGHFRRLWGCWHSRETLGLGIQGDSGLGTQGGHSTLH